MSPSRSSTAEPAQLRRAQACAAGSASTASTVAAGTSSATDSAMAPDPVPRSTTTGERPVSSCTERAASMATPATTSVSGRGTNTPGPTARVRWRK